MTNNYTEKNIYSELIQREINTMMNVIEEIQRKNLSQTNRFSGGARLYELRGEFTGLQQKKLNGIQLSPMEEIRIGAFEKLFDFTLRYSVDYELDLVPNENCISHHFDDLEEFKNVLSGKVEISSDELDDEQIDELMNGGCYVSNHWLVDGSGGVDVTSFTLKSLEELKKVGYEPSQTQ